MKRLALPFVLALLSVSMAVPSCAHTPPIVNDVVTCGGHAVAPADVQEAYQDLASQNWGDLAAEGVRLGWDVIACVIDDLTAAHPELKPAGAKFKADHADQIRKAEAPSVSLRGPILEKLGAKNFQMPTGEAMPARAGISGDERAPLAIDPGEGRTVSARAEMRADLKPAPQFVAAVTGPGDSASPGKLTTFAYAGETVSHAANRCQADCGRGVPAIGSPGRACLCQRGGRWAELR